MATLCSRMLFRDKEMSWDSIALYFNRHLHQFRLGELFPFTYLTMNRQRWTTLYSRELSRRDVTYINEIIR